MSRFPRLNLLQFPQEAWLGTQSQALEEQLLPARQGRFKADLLAAARPAHLAADLGYQIRYLMGFRCCLALS